jgi:hypothetical protein
MDWMQEERLVGVILEHNGRLMELYDMGHKLHGIGLQ